LFAQLSKKFSKEITHYINYRKLHNKKARNKRQYIAILIFIFNIIIVL
jgi:hypothetical protein